MSDQIEKNPHIVAAIGHCGGKQALLAKELECAQQTVSKLLRGEIDIDADWAVRLARATKGKLPAASIIPELATPTPEPAGSAG